MSTNTLVVYNDLEKRFILLPPGSGTPVAEVELSASPGNNLSQKVDGLYGVSVSYMSWDSGTSRLIVHLSDGTSSSVLLPLASTPPVTFEVQAALDGAQDFTLPSVPKLTGHNLYINGLRQSILSYTLPSGHLVLPVNLLVKTGDQIHFEYFVL